MNTYTHTLRGLGNGTELFFFHSDCKLIRQEIHQAPCLWPLQGRGVSGFGLRIYAVCRKHSVPRQAGAKPSGSRTRIIGH